MCPHLQGVDHSAAGGCMCGPDRPACVLPTVRQHLCVYACENARSCLAVPAGRSPAAAPPAQQQSCCPCFAAITCRPRADRWTGRPVAGAVPEAPPVRAYARARRACWPSSSPHSWRPLLRPLTPSGAAPAAMPAQPYTSPSAGHAGAAGGPDQYPLRGALKRPASTPLGCRAATDSPSPFRFRVTERTRVRIPTSHQSRSLPVRDMYSSQAYARHVMPDLRTP